MDVFVLRSSKRYITLRLCPSAFVIELNFRMSGAVAMIIFGEFQVFG
ncbi:MAG: hypothetical protein Hyperionvirus22_17 [Hyperionvirus sp.]|uniref:Uncharacterized protein n=1 Tax=Hyperionvirus sp. TaxID=2487770 RepID=A0A3G5AAR1_9VIRU|nr:MAG: hypothetical protein Hyperionvirus22_17 [Hyperionvirus sp.]